jgi:hypothetical protein
MDASQLVGLAPTKPHKTNLLDIYNKWAEFKA